LRGAWLERREETPVQRLALSPLVPVSWLYAAGARLDRKRYEAGWRRQQRLAARVISVGNLVVGGAAKTPLAAWLAAALARRGHKVALLSRGYGRSGRGAVEIVSDGRRVLGSSRETGDEPMLLAALAPGVPVLVGRDRGTAGLRAFAAFGADVLLLDDGFQHHRLHRDLDLVCFDGGLGFGNRRVLPRGPLREPLSALSRADGIAVVDGPLPESDSALLARHAPGAPRFEARRRPRGLRPLGGPRELRPVEGLAGARLGLLAGLARPGAVRRTLEALGAEVVAERLFPDHHRYRPEDLRGLAGEAPHWITTEKDAVKLVPAWAGEARVDVLAIEVAVTEPDALLDWIERRLRQSPGSVPGALPAGAGGPR